MKSALCIINPGPVLWEITSNCCALRAGHTCQRCGGTPGRIMCGISHVWVWVVGSKQRRGFYKQ